MPQYEMLGYSIDCQPGGLKYEVQHLSGDNVLGWEQTINS